MKLTVWILFLVLGIVSGAILPGAEMELKNLVSKTFGESILFMKGRKSGPVHDKVKDLMKCTDQWDHNLTIIAVQKCAKHFGLESLILSWIRKSPEPGPPTVNDTGLDIMEFDTKLGEIEVFKDLVANSSHKIPPDMHHMHEGKIPPKIFQYPCFGACIVKALVFTENNTMNTELIKTQMVNTSDDKITPEYADKIIENCFNQTGLNMTEPIALPQGNAVIDAENCRSTFRFSLCIQKSSWELCRYLEP